MILPSALHSLNKKTFHLYTSHHQYTRARTYHHTKCDAFNKKNGGTGYLRKTSTTENAALQNLHILIIK
jgi:hypothetical protein